MQKNDGVARLPTLRALGERILTAWRLFVDPRVPFWTKTLPIAALVYLVWPMDIVTDLVPVLGQLDDLTLLVCAIEAFIRLCPTDLSRKEPTTSQGDTGVTIEGDYKIVD